MHNWEKGLSPLHHWEEGLSLLHHWETKDQRMDQEGGEVKSSGLDYHRHCHHYHLLYPPGTHPQMVAIVPAPAQNGMLSLAGQLC